MATIQIADKPTLDEIKAQVASNNTEDAQGTIHQKLTAIWNYVKSVLGRPEDGGGTVTSGSIAAKLNELLATWSVTRAGYVDRLANGTYGLDKIKADTGSILSKVNGGVTATVTPKYYAASDTVLASPSYYTSNMNPVKSNYKVFKVSDNWIPKANGIVRCSIGLSATVTSTVASKYQNVVAGVYFLSAIPLDGYSSKVAGYASKSKGTAITEVSSDSSFYSYLGTCYVGTYNVVNVNFSATSVGETQTGTGTYTADIPVQAGYPVFAVVLINSTSVSNSYGTATAKVTSFSIKGALNNA